MERQMTFRDAQDLAMEFGAKKFSRNFDCPTFGC
jgi:hypothetical protein